MPPLHIKLRLTKNFVKAMAKHCLTGFEFLCRKFPKLNQAKLKEGIFLVHKFGTFLNTQSFKKLINTLKLQAWQAFKRICSNFQVTFIPRRCCRVPYGIQRDGVSHVFENVFPSFTP